MSATVTLDTVWLNSTTDPSDALRCAGVAGLEREPEVQGRVQRVAGGGLRFIRRPGAPRTWKVKLPWATRTEVDWLEAHLGQTVTCRDHRGHKLQAVYLEVPVRENGVTTQAGVALELVEVTHSEVV